MKTPALAASMLLVTVLTGDASATEFSVQTVRYSPFRAVALWAPPPGSTGTYETVLLLHGNQPGAPNPTWMVDLRYQPQFAGRILIAPALGADGYEWGETANVRALAALLDDLARRYPIDRRRVHLVGYSAGASRVLSVAQKIRFTTITAIAGDVLRPLRGRSSTLAPALRAAPIHLLCLLSDGGPHTSCDLNERNLRDLRRLGASPVDLLRVPGTHQIDFAVVAPIVDKWLLGTPRPSDPSVPRGAAHDR